MEQAMGGVRDPSKHEAASLRQFLSMIGARPPMTVDDTHWPGKGEPQKGNAQKVTFKSLKSDLKVI